MNEYTVNRDTKLLMLSIFKAGYCTEQQREQLAEAFGLYTKQENVLSEESVNELIKSL